MTFVEENCSRNELGQTERVYFTDPWLLLTVEDNTYVSLGPGWSMKSSTNKHLTLTNKTMSMVEIHKISQIICCCFFSLQLFIFMCRIMLRLAPNTFPHSGQPIFAWSCWCFSNDRWLMKDLGFSVHLPILHTQEPVSIWALLLWSFR